MKTKEAEGWDKEKQTQNYLGINAGKTLSAVNSTCRRLIDINDDTSFKTSNEYFGKQIPPDVSVSQWEDPMFPPNETSMLHLKPNNDVYPEEIEELKTFKWLRAKDLFRNGRFSLYDDLSMDDVSQGSLGNCYFLSVLSELANRPDIYDKIFITKSASKNNCYLVKFLIRGIPKIVCIDDYFPATQRNQFAFAMSGPRELWVQVLEKAWAKVNSSYAMTIAGIPSESFNCLSEAPCVTYIHKKYQNDHDAIWKILKRSKAMGYYLATNTKTGQMETYGLVQGHAYSLTNLEEFELGGGKKLRLIQLRNPWGNFEWQGKYSDTSDDWNIIPNLKEKVGFQNKDDGVFYMEFEDFLQFYPYTFILKYHKDFVYDYKKLEQQSLDHNTCAKFVLNQKATVKIGLHAKQLRFYSKVKNYQVQPARIIIAKYDRANKKYTYIGSDFHTEEVLYAETTKNLEPGEYHIFLNIYWPYSAKNTYTLSTYSSVDLNIQELDKEDVPLDYLEQILIDYLNKNVPKEPLSADTTLQVSSKDNNLGFYMALITNESNNQYKFSTGVKYSKVIFLQNDLVTKRSKNAKDEIDDTIVGVLPRGGHKLLVWKLLKEPWECKIELCDKKLFAFEEEVVKKDEIEEINEAFPGLNKKCLNDDIFYTEIENGDDVIVVFKNIGRYTYKFEIEFTVLENLTINGDAWTSKQATFPLLSDKLFVFKLVQNDPNANFNFTFTYSYKKIGGTSY